MVLFTVARDPGMISAGLYPRRIGAILDGLTATPAAQAGLSRRKLPLAQRLLLSADSNQREACKGMSQSKMADPGGSIFSCQCARVTWGFHDLTCRSS